MIFIIAQTDGKSERKNVGKDGKMVQIIIMTKQCRYCENGYVKNEQNKGD